MSRPSRPPTFATNARVHACCCQLDGGASRGLKHWGWQPHADSCTTKHQQHRRHHHSHCRLLLRRRRRRHQQPRHQLIVPHRANRLVAPTSEQAGGGLYHMGSWPPKVVPNPLEAWVLVIQRRERWQLQRAVEKRAGLDIGRPWVPHSLSTWPHGSGAWETAVGVRVARAHHQF